MQYEAPLKDLRFAMRASGALDAVLALPVYRDLSLEIVDAVLDEAGKFLDAKIATALFYLEAILPQTSSLISTITRGSARVMGMDAVDFKARRER